VAIELLHLLYQGQDGWTLYRSQSLADAGNDLFDILAVLLGLVFILQARISLFSRAASSKPKSSLSSNAAMLFCWRLPIKLLHLLTN
jgi:hypothetical protein